MRTDSKGVPGRPSAGRAATAWLAVALAAALVASGGCAAVAPEIEQAPAELARTEVAVKEALVEALGIDGAAVGVSVAGERVTLEGFVADAAQRDRALAAARDAAGTMSVVDALELRR